MKENNGMNKLETCSEELMSRDGFDSRSGLKLERAKE